jgi:hypothetical protein
MRRLNAGAWGVLVRALFRIKIRDIDCAFKLFPNDLIRTLDLKSVGAGINTEILAKLALRKVGIYEVPVTHLPRMAGKPTGANLTVIAKAFRELLNLRQELKATASTPATPASQLPRI